VTGSGYSIPDEIKVGGETVRIVTPFLTPMAERALGGLGVEWESGQAVTIDADAGNLYSVLDVLKSEGLRLTSVSPSSETLEAAFLRLAA